MAAKYGHMFRDRNGDDYLFINNLAKGSFQLAQRVLHLRTGRVVVRKICLTGKYKDNNENWDAGLAAQLNRTEWVPIEGVEPPRFARLISATPSAVDSFWELYNCGSIMDIEETMPFDVVHNDLDLRNVWVHLPAQDQDRTLRGSPSTTDRWNLLALKDIVNKLHKQCVNEVSFEKGTVKDLIPFIKTTIASVSQLEAAHSSAGKPILEPEFAQLLKDRTNAITAPKHGDWQGQPLLHDTMQEIKIASGIRGPWYIAEVDPCSQHVSNIGRDARG
ncbi:hypothetical protein MGG_10401 [Pyricularia oryzae 70-15]|uniref:Protein kinase domain-containing protein n=1 Tax=Pyricularia oryzae (strain 70-15 / ATCC MYA-4617 / FGSC 8958) TaxID=242507 RepID=G4NG96_PYRO7|nr:uncharacterized protein MGG_10401 [Pyricularia oryzae 70-15]EHA47053.1 hypothetical protein MGG_10401 [Pyricularia oryzae 70-15]